MNIIPLTPADEQAIHETAALLTAGFRHSWQAPEEALQEVHESFEEDRLSLIAVDNGEVIGWIGAQPAYGTRTYELHPLVVKETWRGKGVGRALVEALEAEAVQRGVETMILGTDDEDNQTSLSGVNLYPDVWTHIATIQNLDGHPYEFYQRLGYVISGVVPDANGPGKPDILMAKRLVNSLQLAVSS